MRESGKLPTFAVDHADRFICHEGYGLILADHNKVSYTGTAGGERQG